MCQVASLGGGCGTDRWLFGAWRCLLPQGWRRSRLCYFLGGGANSSFTEDVISKDDTQMLLLGFSFTFFFFCHSCLVINTLGGCYEFHAGVSFLRAWGCDETALEWLGARFFFWSDPCGVLGLCQNFPSTHPPVTLPPPTGDRGDVVCPPPPTLPLPRLRSGTLRPQRLPHQGFGKCAQRRCHCSTSPSNTGVGVVMEQTRLCGDTE